MSAPTRTPTAEPVVDLTSPGTSPGERPSVGPPRAPGGVPPGRIPAWSLSLVYATAALWIALGEIDRMIGQAVGADGTTATVSQLMGLGAATAQGSWTVWGTAEASFGVTELLRVYGVVELVFVTAGLMTVAAVTAGSGRRLLTRPYQGLSVTLLVLVAAELTEAFLYGRLVSILAEGGAVVGWSTALTVVTYVKWVAVAGLVVALFASSTIRSRLRIRARRVVPALWHQRLSALVVGVYVGVALLPGDGVPDQFPDVLRGWVAVGWVGPVHAAAAVLGSLLVTVALFWTGRLRSYTEWCRYEKREPTPDRPPSMLWLVPAATALSAAAVLVGLGRDDLVDPVPLTLFAGAVIGIWCVSGVLYAVGVPARLVGVPDRADRLRVRYAYAVGDVLAVSFFALGAVAFVRAFTAPAVLAFVRADGLTQPQVARLVLLLAACVVVVGWAPAARALLEALDARRPSGAVSPAEGRLRHLLVPGLAAAALLGLMLWPVPTAQALGMASVTFLALACWVVLLTAFIVHLSRRQPLQLFAALGARSAPVLSLFVVLPLVVSLGGGDRDLHAVPGEAPAGVPARDDLDAAFDSWLQSSAVCDRDAGTADLSARPLLLVAAQGGGIRAAVWTAQGLERLDGECSRQAVFLSSGVSGGSVGLVAGRSDDPVAATETLSEPAGLGSAVTGLVVGDAIGGATGVRVPSGGPGLSWDWRDRAGLMEAAWATSGGSGEAPPQLERMLEPWDAGVSDDGGATVAFARPAGALILNTAAAGSGCRVVISQLDLDPSGTAGGPDAATDTCRGRSGLPPGTLDYHDMVGDCVLRSSWLTMAMVSARFPTVTPAARAPLDAGEAEGGGCAADPQLVDGGYAEGSGLGTLADVAPSLMEQVQAHNESAVRAGVGSVVVPFVVYLRNAPGGDLTAVEPPLSAELLVPLAGLAARDLQMSEGAWLQRLEQAIGTPCPASTVGDGCRRAVAGLRDPVRGSVIVVTPSTQPAVDAPLGWTLSGGSRTRLANAMTEQAEQCEQVPTQSYGCFGDLLRLLDRP